MQQKKEGGLKVDKMKMGDRESHYIIKERLKKMKKAIGLVLALIIVLAMVAACGPQAGDQGQPGVVPPPAGNGQAPAQDSPGTTPAAPEGSDKHGGTIRFVSTVEGAGPLGTVWDIQGQDAILVGPVKQTLVVELQDATAEPLLAHTWTVDADAGTIRFYLQEGVIFHDGSPFNAEVVKWNFDLINERMSLGFPFDTEIVDNYTVDVRFHGGVTNASVTNFGSHNLRIISMYSFLANGEDWARYNPVGTGAFKMVEYVPGLHVIHERFDDYWEPGLPYLDSIEFHMIGDVMTLSLAMQAPHGPGAIDGMITSNGDQIRLFQGLDYQVNLRPGMVISIFPDSDNPDSPFSNNYVRQAVSAAIDRDAIVAARGEGVWIPFYQIIIPTRPAHVADPNYGVPRFDPEYARELLARAGFPDGFSTTMINQPGAGDRDAMVAIQHQLEQIGIQVDLQFPEGGAFSSQRANGWDGLMQHAVMNFVHVENNFTGLFGQEANQFFSMQNSDELEALGQAAHFLGDNRAELRAAQDYMLSNCLVIPLWLVNTAVIYRQGVNDGFNPLMMWPDWRGIWVDW